MCIALARSRIDCIRSHWIRIAHGSHGSIVSNSNLLVQPMPSKIAMSRPPPAPNEPSSQSHNWDQPGSTPVNSPPNLRRGVPVPPIFHWGSTDTCQIFVSERPQILYRVSKSEYKTPERKLPFEIEGSCESDDQPPVLIRYANPV